jgi:hypothetical protein
MACTAGRSAALAGRTRTGSAGIVGLLAIEDALERAEVRPGIGRGVLEDHAVRRAHDFRAHGAQPAACLCHHGAREHLEAAGALEVVQEVERLGDARPHHDHAVVGEEEHALVAEHRRQPVALGGIHHEPVVRVVIGDVVIEAQGVLLDHLQPAVLEQRQRGRVRHVRMQDARCLGILQVDPGMDIERGLLERALPLQDAALGIQGEQVRRGDLAPVQPVGVEKEALAVGKHQREVVAHALVQVHPDRHAEGRGEVHARCALDGRQAPQLEHCPHGINYSVAMHALPRLIAASLLALLVACSKVTPENFAKVQNGMTEQEVIAILGSPTESTSREVLGITGTASSWVSGDTAITIRFVGGKVATKALDKPLPK